ATTGQSNRSNQAGPCPNGARIGSKIALVMRLKVCTRGRTSSGDVAETPELAADVLVVLRVLEVDHLLLEDVGDELLGRRIAGDVRDSLDAIVEVAVELDRLRLSETEHRSPPVLADQLPRGSDAKMSLPSIPSDSGTS